ncbi:MAG: alpha/beta hydrolase family protein [Christensenellales bacterium]|jgi:pimeloyl-ACP methyl ester carboxylesterase
MRAINYLFLAVAVLIFLGLRTLKKRKIIQKKWQRRTINIAGRLVAILLILMVVFLPHYPPLPVTGPYACRMQTIQFTQPDRKDPYHPDQNRTLVMDYYYPVSDHLDRHSVPLVVFSHGGISTRKGNVSLFSELASHGYAVASLDHPYQALSTTINGRKVRMDGGYFRELMGENSHRDIQNSFECFQRWMAIRIQDMDAAIHCLTDRATQGEKAFALINPEAIGVGGHSLGGSAALGIARLRPDIKAVLALESPYLSDITGIAGESFTWNRAPYEAAILNIYSDSGMPLVEKDHKYAQNKNHLAHTDTLDYLHIQGANHFTLTDLVQESPLFCFIIGGYYDTSGEDGLKEINRAALSFFDKNLKANTDNLSNTPNAHP